MYAESVKALMPLVDTQSANRINYLRYNNAVYTGGEAGEAATVTQGFVGQDFEVFAQSNPF